MKDQIRRGIVDLGLSDAARASGVAVFPFASGLFELFRVDLPSTSRAPARSLIVKCVSSLDMAEAEWDGLVRLREAGAVVPELIGFVKTDSGGRSGALLFLSMVSGGRGSVRLDTLIQIYSTRGESYGYSRDNYIGSLHQRNRRYATFEEFWAQDRIFPQLNMAISAGLLTQKDLENARRVLDIASGWELSQPGPRLIHGDLWNGNLLIDSDMNPVLIDPSVSYSHPEQDLAMLELFGSPLSSSDLDLLARETGLPAGRIERRDFFQLYPLLVHVNLFGASYVSQARRAIGRYL